MIGVIAQGRLGNQMFQIAFAYATAKKLNTDFFLYQFDSVKYFELTEKFEIKNKKNRRKYIKNNFFKISKIPFSFAGLKSPVSYFSHRWVYKNITDWDNTLNENNYLLKKTDDNCIYKGYFQSEEYFKDYRDDLLRLFTLKTGFVTEYNNKIKPWSDKKYIAVHIRRSDYKHCGEDKLGGEDLTLPLTYYKNSLSVLKDINYAVVFVTDDIEFARKEFGNHNGYFFENNDEITDFQILLNADKAVIANSSFSWWAAWLNQKVNKEIYAPEYYLGFRVKKYYPAGIKVKEWNWIPVN